MKTQHLNENCWVTAELTNFCNYSCPACSQFNPNLGCKGFMSPDTFKSIIDDLVQNKIKVSNFNPFFRGESLIHPQFAELMHYAVEKLREFEYMEYIVLHTNGFYLTEQNTDAILYACDQSIIRHPGNLVISLDASYEPLYSEIRPGGNLETVMNNIDSLLLKREQRGQFGPNILFQCIVQQKNLHDCVKFRDMWKQKLESITRKPVIEAYSKDNEPITIQSDTIYFRMLESDSLSFENNRAVYEQALRMLGYL